MAGNNLEGSEKMWEAASHAVMAVAQQRGWRCSERRDLHEAARMLSEESGDPSIADRFAIAEKFRANFHHDFMEEYDFDDDRRGVRDFVARVLDLVE